MWWQSVLTVLTFGIYTGTKARRQVAKDRAQERQREWVSLRERLRGRTKAKLEQDKD